PAAMGPIWLGGIGVDLDGRHRPAGGLRQSLDALFRQRSARMGLAEPRLCEAAAVAADGS
ncbi:hypothetical protein QU38_00925, partial [Staphylococcus aureus]